MGTTFYTSDLLKKDETDTPKKWYQLSPVAQATAIGGIIGIAGGAGYAWFKKTSYLQVIIVGAVGMAVLTRVSLMKTPVAPIP